MNRFAFTTLIVVLGATSYFATSAYSSHKEDPVVHFDYSTYIASAKEDVVMYSWKHCDSCKLAKEYLSRNDIAFEEREVTENKEYNTHLEEIGVNSVPFIVYNGKGYKGYSKSLYQTLFPPTDKVKGK
jgi:glutaredoxin-like protein NrdH